MPQYIVKPERELDFYIYWSTVTDSPWQWGSRSVMESEDDGGSFKPERFARADETGTSSLDGFFDWAHDEFIVYNMGNEPFVVERRNLFAWCASISGDGGPKTTWDASLTKELVWEDEPA